MQQFLEVLARTRKYLYFFMAFCMFGWALGPDSYQPTFLGLFIGTGASLFNILLLVKKMHAFDKAMEESAKIYGLGTISRMATAVVVCLIAIEYPQKIHLISVVIGLMTAYIVIMVIYLVHYFILHRNGEKRGE
ncbi:ATP synthase subunit I [Bacillus sp. B1-b2]|uniref:ATP synthase subunit I n=1 Tax=Bacillus sp. B1-b2 TaxID=2653201 RepID=UPI0012622CDD|nr:ATP synthase subunit I [Bacillus sp. B1-b2]KAB7671831.1 ATP synthase subunit I [Bacillus sp. B1-b2]